jgi:Ni,Fe-hydrogenase III small subunit
VCIAIGKGHEVVPEGTICIGNCAAVHRHRGIFIPGCPPVSSEILTALSGRPAVDSADGRIEKPRRARGGAKARQLDKRSFSK